MSFPGWRDSVEPQMVNVFRLVRTLALTGALSYTILRDYVWLYSGERRSRRVAHRAAFATVFITAVVGFIYAYILAQKILVGDLLEKLDPAVVPRLVNISLFLATGLPAIVSICVGLLVHKILHRFEPGVQNLKLEPYRAILIADCLNKIYLRIQ